MSLLFGSQNTVPLRYSDPTSTVPLLNGQGCKASSVPGEELMQRTLLLLRYKNPPDKMRRPTSTASPDPGSCNSEGTVNLGEETASPGFHLNKNWAFYLMQSKPSKTFLKIDIIPIKMQIGGGGGSPKHCSRGPRCHLIPFKIFCLGRGKKKKKRSFVLGTHPVRSEPTLCYGITPGRLRGPCGVLGTKPKSCVQGEVHTGCSTALAPRKNYFEKQEVFKKVKDGAGASAEIGLIAEHHQVVIQKAKKKKIWEKR